MWWCEWIDSGRWVYIYEGVLYLMSSNGKPVNDIKCNREKWFHYMLTFTPLQRILAIGSEYYADTHSLQVY